MHNVRIILAFLLSTSTVFAAEVHFVPGITVSGNTAWKGELIRLTERELEWRDENNNSIVQPLQAVMDIDLQPPVPLPNGLKYTDVELIDGSLLHCSRFALKPKDVELTLAVSDQV